MMVLITTLLTPLRYGFVQEALLAGIAVAIMGALLSPYLLYRGWSLMGDAVAHALLPGLLLALFLGVPLLVGGVVAGLLCAFGVLYFGARTTLKSGALMGILFSGLVALGLFLYQFLGIKLPIQSLLLGNIFAVEGRNLTLLWGVSIGVISLLVGGGRMFKMVTFDPIYTHTVAPNGKGMTGLLLLLLTVVIVVAVDIIGILMVSAFLITPGLTGRLLSNRFWMIQLLGGGATIIALFGGVIISFYYNIESAPPTILLQALLFLLALLKHQFWSGGYSSGGSDKKCKSSPP